MKKIIAFAAILFSANIAFATCESAIDTHLKAFVKGGDQAADLNYSIIKIEQPSLLRAVLSVKTQTEIAGTEHRATLVGYIDYDESTCKMIEPKIQSADVSALTF